MKYTFGDLVDIPTLNNLMQSFYHATGIPSGIIDVEGNVLVAVGWQDICLNFHRKNSLSEKACRQSDDYLRQHLRDATPYMCYTCENGLVDAAAPIVINDVHLATVFQGQFFFRKPNISFFEHQADRYGFDKEAYLAALAKVPIYTSEKLHGIMCHFILLAKMLAETGMIRLEQIELQAQELKRTDEQIFKIFNSTPDIAIQGYDEYGVINFWNNASERVFGFAKDEVFAKPLNSILTDEQSGRPFLTILKKIAASNSLYGPVEWKTKHKNGKDVYVYSTLLPIELSMGRKVIICMDVDITAQKHYAKELERLEQLNVVGEMAASLGHEIRNPMTTVLGYLQMIRNKNGCGEYTRQFDIMIDELNRANGIISEYLSLARSKAIEKCPCNLNEIIEKILPLLYAESLQENKAIEWSKGDIQSRLLDEKEMRQLVINLVHNALEAIDQGGTVMLSTFMDNEAVVLKVQDNGPGMPKELLDKIGTPFVTTKINGTGLGLAVCFSIVARHNAKIVIESSSLGTAIFVKF